MKNVKDEKRMGRNTESEREKKKEEKDVGNGVKEKKSMRGRLIKKESKNLSFHFWFHA
jgi:hypothetical protein